MELFETINLRQSVRKYKEGQIPAEALDDIVNAASAAPVGMAAFKTLKLAVIQDPDFLKRINEAGKKAMNMSNPDMSLYYNAPTLIVVFSEEGRMPGIEYANAGAVMENMLLAATAHGLGSVYLFMTNAAFGADPSLKEELGIPESFNAVSAAAIGYAEDTLSTRDTKGRIEVIQK